jgi:hypothetical protein
MTNLDPDAFLAAATPRAMDLVELTAMKVGANPPTKDARDWLVVAIHCGIAAAFEELHIGGHLRIDGL